MNEALAKENEYTDETKNMRRLVKELLNLTSQNWSSDLVERTVKLLKELTTVCDSDVVIMEFINIGGAKLLAPFVCQPNAEVKLSALELTKHACEQGAVYVLADLASKISDDYHRQKAMEAMHLILDECGLLAPNFYGPVKVIEKLKELAEFFRLQESARDLARSCMEILLEDDGHGPEENRFAPCDLKFATGGDDSTSRIWDFKTLSEERVLRGHGSDVRAVDWHLSKEKVFVSGGSDGSLIYWDMLSDHELTLIEGAHEQATWALSLESHFGLHFGFRLQRQQYVSS
ncbi:WD40 domain containing protein [Trichuris trichiura]|uniref:WD40 domain containing protein n=1 Tax=Trichuris trichiura TaxID=36087 RepID=A0A077Z2T2_TRITR|nr:WD40 domain containing protein [Trichuris trichiura]